MAQPLEMTIRPPPTCTTGMEIPKKSRMCEPIRTEAIRRMKLFMATWRARILRTEAGYSRVKARKTGLPPRGLTMGNRALRMRSVLLATSSKGGLRRAEYSRDGFLEGHGIGRPAERVGGGIVGAREFLRLLVGDSHPPRVFCKCCI